MRNQGYPAGGTVSATVPPRVGFPPGWVHRPDPCWEAIGEALRAFDDKVAECATRVAEAGTVRPLPVWVERPEAKR